jgi:hypothetical protein
MAIELSPIIARDIEAAARRNGLQGIVDFFGAPDTWSPMYLRSDEFDEFRTGDQRLTRVLSNANAAGHEVIGLRALRPLAMRGLEGWNPDVVRTIHGYDAAVIWKGAHASSS